MNSDQFDLRHFSFLSHSKLSTVHCAPFTALEFQSRFARRIGQRLDPPVVKETTTVEDHLLDALFDGQLGNRFADLAAAATFPPVFSLMVEADTRVTPFWSSMTCA